MNLQNSPLVLLAAASVVLSACSYPDRGKPLERLGADLGIVSAGSAYDSPKMRLGTMPFNAWYSPLIPLGINDLGRHAYVAPGVSGNRGGEAGRGTLYCADAGFVDIAHVRNAMDLTRFVFDHVAACLYHGMDQLEIVAAEPDVYTITFHPPPAWGKLSQREFVRPEILEEVREASIKIAGRTAYLMTCWHEVLTTFGYKGMGLITEKPSAFSYDDAVSHRIGVDAAMRALRHDTNLANFNANATATLHDVLTELGVLPVEELKKRIDQSKGTFWKGSQPILRIVDLGMDGEPLTARLVDERIKPRQWSWSENDLVGDTPVQDLFDISITMNTFEAGAIYRALGKDGGPIEPRRDFPALRLVLEKMLDQ